LSGNGNPAGGVLSGSNGTAYLMTNWGDATSQQPDATTSSSYASTCRFTIRPSVTAYDSRGATPDMTNANGKNALLFNIQRAIAQISFETIPTSVLTNAGSGDAAGTFVPDAKWAVGNINMSVYPFQQFDAKKVKSTLYDSIGSINENPNWSKQLDNSRWIPSSESYVAQNLTVTGVRNQINSCTSNQSFGIANKVLVTENNNKNTLTAYSTFVLYSGQYRPNKYITDVDNLGNVTYVTGTPATDPVWTATDGKDTLYYIHSPGVFIWGTVALKRYIGWKILAQSPTYDPAATAAIDATHAANLNAVITYINTLKTTSGGSQADLQAYWHGYCFYRGWIRDASAFASANKILVRRNHVYQISVTQLQGPGIANPNDIIDAQTHDLQSVIDYETYATTSINIVPWHIVLQPMVNGVD